MSGDEAVPLQVIENRAAGESAIDVAVPAAVARLHRELGLADPTALVELVDVAAAIGVGRLFVKDESTRGELPAFKILGASWASFRVLCDRFGLDATTASVDDVRGASAAAGEVPVLVTATDGNHGRAVAHSARVLGVGARILVPAGTSARRIDAIRSEGAECEVVAGDYDDAVAAAAALTDRTHIVVSDTSWDGYDTVPRWVVEGYDTLFGEIDAQLDRVDAPAPTVVVIPVGVGSLAVAGVGHYAGRPRDRRPDIVGVEPVGADCLAVSVRRGESVTVPGPHDSVMAGLNCGTVSRLAWPVLHRGVDWCLVVDDEPVADAMRTLAEHGVESGETGAAALAALVEWSRTGSGVPYGADDVVVVLSTEGATDPVSYRRIVDPTGSAERS